MKLYFIFIKFIYSHAKHPIYMVLYIVYTQLYFSPIITS